MHDSVPIKIESGVPLQFFYNKTRRTRYPFSTMAVGDSFAINGDDRERERVRAAASKHSLRHGVKLVVRQQEHGFRVYRLA